MFEQIGNERQVVDVPSRGYDILSERSGFVTCLASHTPVMTVLCSSLFMAPNLGERFINSV